MSVFLSLLLLGVAQIALVHSRSRRGRRRPTPVRQMPQPPDLCHRPKGPDPVWTEYQLPDRRLKMDRVSAGRVYVSKARDVMTTVIARGSAVRQDAVNKS